MKKRNYKQVSIVFLVVILLLLYTFTQENKELERATWLWDTQLIKDDTETITNLIKEKNLTTIYVQFSTDIEMSYYQKFIKELKWIGVKVHALDGSPTWANSLDEEENFLTWFRTYQQNSNPEEQFEGIHLDVEPYLQDGWESKQEEIVEEYQAMIKRVNEVSNELNVVFGLDIPFWFDEINFYNQFGQGNLAKWLIETVDEITIMAYRNFANGEGGIIEISKNEIKWANEANKKVIIAVETVELPETYTSFYGMSNNFLDNELEILRTNFKRDKSFSGIAVHHLLSWSNME